MVFAEPINNSFDLGNWFIVLNNDSGGWMGFGILLTMFVVMFIAFKAYSSAKAFAAASFLTFLFSLMLGAIGLVSYLTIGICALMVGFAFVAVHLEKSNSAL